MPQGRHSLAPRASKPRRLALVAAPLLTTGLVGIGVATTGAGTSLAGDEVDFSTYSSGTSATAARTTALSRSATRATVRAGAKLPAVKRTLWTTADLDLRIDPRDASRVDGEVPALRKVGVTGVRRNGFAQVVFKREVRWVTAEYLARKKPTSPAHLPLIDRPCPGTSGVESGLTPAAVRVYRAVCNQFPQITGYGGWDNHGEHTSGRAIDIMTSDVAVGTAIAEFLRAHAAALDLYNVIWRQRIFTQERGGEGWRPMSDRGSATANHYDHVHVSVY